MKKKKKRNNSPKRWRLKRPARLQKAKTWIPTCTSKNIAKSYRNYFKVDILCAIHELKILGVDISHDYEKAVKESIANKKKKQKPTEEDPLAEYRDENFAFIFGYTSGGFPYGVTWEQSNLLEDNSDDDIFGDASTTIK